jgi:RNA polymerase sigma-70 factor (ECF subfamily)
MPLLGPSIPAGVRALDAADRGAPPRPDDAALMAAFEAGEPGAGERLYDRLVPVVDATIARILGGRESDHADLVQAAFEQIVGTLLKRRYAGRCSLAGWAASIACHVGLNALRARRRERRVIERRRQDDAEDASLGVIERAPAPTSLDTQLRARDELAAVRLHLAQMAPERVTALLLNAMGHDLSEVAELTQTSVAAAQSRLSRARRELRERLGDGRADDQDDSPARLK